MIQIRNIRYVRLGTRNLEEATRFATRIIGLQETGRIGGSPGSQAAVYFRSDNRHHTLVYVEGDPSDQVVAFEVDEVGALKAAARQFAQQGLAPRIGSRDECATRNVAAMIALSDPSGNAIELIVPARDTDAAFVAPRAAGIAGFGHVALRSTDPARDEVFWTSLFGARVSDRIGNAPMLRFDEMHHRVALLPANRPGIEHLAHNVGTIDDVMRAWNFLRDNGVRILFGPGREPTSTAIYLQFEGPDGMVFELLTGAKMISMEANHRPRHFPFAPRSFCMWGGKPDFSALGH